MPQPLNITVMLGGPSAEREVSLRSGHAVANALRDLGHTVYELDPKEGSFVLEKSTDVVFLALHGSYGEDGVVQSQLEELGVPYTGCGVEASRLAFDKVAAKERCLKAGLLTAPYKILRSASEPWPAGWKPPVVLKPVRQGSSVGLYFVNSVEDWAASLKGSLEFDSEVLMEQRIEGREITAGILDGQALPLVEVRPRKGSYDYHNKYTRGATDYFCPAEFEPSVTARAQEAAIKAFQAVGGRDYGRVDIIIQADGSPYILEVNTLPGMTETSLLPKAAKAAGLDYGQLCQKMISLAMRRKRPL